MKGFNIKSILFKNVLKVWFVLNFNFQFCRGVLGVGDFSTCILIGYSFNLSNERRSNLTVGSAGTT
jgi:hypothetical protein